MNSLNSNNKILFLTLRSDWGGAPKHIDILCKNIEPDFKCYIAAPISEPFGTEWLATYGKDKFFELKHRSFSLLRLLALILFIKKNNIHVVHAHGKGAGLYARLIKLLLLSKVKVIFTFHGLHIAQYSPLKKKLYIFYERISSKFTDLFINVSNGERKNCINLKIFNPLKSQVVYNAIPAVVNYKTKLQLRDELHLPNDKFIVLSIVRFSFAKNIEDTVAIAESLKLDSRFLFVLVGDGETRNDIQNKINNKRLNNILITGFKDNPLDYIISSDVYLSTSRWEGLPYSLIEACMIGLPIIATDVVGNNEVVFEDKNGKLFNPDDLKSAVNSIVEICSNKKLSDLYSLNGKEIYTSNFSVDNMTTKMIDIYKTCLN
jgi:glycosyltransferase involved in cell wall biosynthesis